MDTPPVLLVSSLEGSLKDKVDIISADFEKKHGVLPQFVARVPGR